VNLEFTPDSLVEIAEKAIARNTGARGLRSIMESILRKAMFELPTRGDIDSSIVDADVVKNGEPLKLIERDEAAPQQQQAGAAG